MKRIIPFIAVFALLFCMIPVSAQAADSYVFDLYDRDSATFSCPDVLLDGWYSLDCRFGDTSFGFFDNLYLSFSLLDSDVYFCEILASSSFGQIFTLQFTTVSPDNSMIQFLDASGEPAVINEIDASSARLFLTPIPSPFPVDGQKFVVDSDLGGFTSSQIFEPGEYNLYGFLGGSFFESNSSTDFYETELEGIVGYCAEFSVFSGVEAETINLFVWFMDELYCAVLFMGDSFFTPSYSDLLFLEPVGESASTVPPLSGIVDSDMMTGVLGQVVSILPIVLVVIVAFIGIRKGISFLRGILSGA